MDINVKPYFPRIYGSVECHKCDKITCPCREKGQRDKREFTVTSGRCPRLPDMRGAVHDSERELYANTFPLIHAELGYEDVLHVSLTIPHEKRNRKVYRTKSGYWYFNTKEDSGFIKRLIRIGTYNRQDIIEYMHSIHADYCLFNCELTDQCV